jgi:ornithine cyclodeaminase/alanine dehydrogenase-like protein (mu-crystallin family)
MNPIFVSAEQVAHCLPYEECIPLMREAMIALSESRTKQLLRSILDLPQGRAFGAMLGAMLDDATFGAKLISVYPDNFEKGGHSHQGVVVMFDAGTGAPAAVLEAGEITAIRTAAASAAATDALARPDARRLAILGYGEQGWRHVEAIRLVRPLEHVAVWGRSPERAEAFAGRVRAACLAATAAPTAREAVADADIVCTVTAAPEPVLLDEWVPDGAHINAVGSSRAGPAEIDNALVVRSRFFADHRDGVLAQGAEFLRAKAAGLIGDDHLLGEIGEVMSGTLPGRLGERDVTIYKSLGSIVQDLAAARHIVAKLRG